MQLIFLQMKKTINVCYAIEEVDGFEFFTDNGFFFVVMF